MKKILTLILFLFTIPVFAQEMNMEEAMKMAAPGPQHQLLNNMAGKYTQKVKINMPTDKSVMESDGTATIESILGGRFVQINSQSTMMGITIKTMTILGFDKRKDKYTLFSIDEMGTYSVTGEGDYNEKTKKLTLSGTEYDPKYNYKQDYKFIFDFSNDKARKMNIVFINPDGSENNIVEIISTKTE